MDGMPASMWFDQPVDPTKGTTGWKEGLAQGRNVYEESWMRTVSNMWFC